MEIKDRELIIRSPESPREGWEEAFAKMTRHGDDEMFDGTAESESTWDKEEWEW